MSIYNRGDGSFAGDIQIRADAARKGEIVSVHTSKRFAATDACRAAMDLLVKAQALDASMVESLVGGKDDDEEEDDFLLL